MAILELERLIEILDQTHSLYDSTPGIMRSSRLLAFRSFAFLGDLYKQIDLEKAKWAYQKASSLIPNSARIHFALGIVYSKLGLNTQAITEYVRALDLDKNFKDAYRHLADAYMNSGQWIYAEFFYRKCIEIDSNYAEAYFRLGFANYNQGKIEQAKEFFLKALLHADERKKVRLMRRLPIFLTPFR